MELKRMEIKMMIEISNYICTHDYPPSFQEINEKVSKSTNGQLTEHFRVLRDKGLIESDLDWSDRITSRAFRIGKKFYDIEDELYQYEDIPLTEMKRSYKIGEVVKK